MTSGDRVNQELPKVWKRVVLAYPGQYRNLSAVTEENHSRCPGQCSKETPSEFKSRMLPLRQPFPFVSVTMWKMLLGKVHESSVHFRKQFAGQLAPTGMVKQTL
jgi:hypothetical protein